MSAPRSDLRRRLLKAVGAFFLAETLLVGPVAAATRPAAAARRTLAAFLDTLLPADAQSGSASALKVDRKLWVLAAGDARFARLLALGCRWLDMTGTGSFADLSPADRIRVVEWMAGSEWNEIPRRFYELVRQVAVEFYYSDPAAWGGLPIRTPPQPLGYPPPWP